MTSSPRRPPPVALFLGMAVAVIAGFGFATYRIWANDLALADRGRETTARVTEVGSGRHNRVHVVFRTGDGREVTALVGQGDQAPGPRARPGDRIPIVYDPENPTAEVRDARAPENHKVGWLLLVTTVGGMVATPFAVRALLRDSRRRTG